MGKGWRRARRGLTRRGKNVVFGKAHIKRPCKTPGRLSNQAIDINHRTILRPRSGKHTCRFHIILSLGLGHAARPQLAERSCVM